MKFSKWQKPGTNEARIYINGAGVDGKPYITSLNGEGESDYWTVKCYGMYPSQLDSLTDRVESAITEMNGGERALTFGEVLAIIGA